MTGKVEHSCCNCGAIFRAKDFPNRHKRRYCSHRCASAGYRARFPEKLVKYKRDFALRHPRYARGAKLRQKYNLTLAQEDALLAKQKGRCAGCGRKFSAKERPHVDHCHNTKVVRGLLCRACNSFAGTIKDDWKRCAQLAEYLRRNELFSWPS